MAKVTNSITWRKSVWENEFKCNRCGNVLSKNGRLTRNVGTLGDMVYCKCGNCVAKIGKPITLDDTEETMTKDIKRLETIIKGYQEQELNDRSLIERLKAKHKTELDGRDKTIKALNKEIKDLEHRLQDMERRWVSND